MLRGPQHTKGSSGVNKSLIRFVVYILYSNIGPENSLDENDTDSMGRNRGTGDGAGLCFMILITCSISVCLEIPSYSPASP